MKTEQFYLHQRINARTIELVSNESFLQYTLRLHRKFGKKRGSVKFISQLSIIAMQGKTL